jgi:hypothetical protein
VPSIPSTVRSTSTPTWSRSTPTRSSPASTSRT